ncbi:hypothetical protein [Streptomyces syringium]|uniref:hypothetical protein n=1 Tax=Streptomyces syringium TaxID=76729 RepID=UPI00345549F9
MGGYDDYRDEMFPDAKTEAANAKNRAEAERIARERQAALDKLSPEERAKIPIEFTDVSPSGMLTSDFGKLLWGKEQ